MFTPEQWEEIASCTENPKIVAPFNDHAILETLTPADWKELYRDITASLFNRPSLRYAWLALKPRVQRRTYGHQASQAA